MKIMSNIYDYRIRSTNLYVETTFGEYLQYAKDLIKNNDLQRKRVKTSQTVYSLLKEDLLNGCVIPPLVLAIMSDDDRLKSMRSDELQDYIKTNKKKVLILDGLQRTHTLIAAEIDALEQKKERDFYNYKLRLEVYVNINRFGVLYRMLTLNTGQTPMSVRHQIEMLYSDMLDKEVNGVKLITEVEGSAYADKNEFVFKNTIDGFNSYMNRSALPMDRQEMLENIKMLEKMSKENISGDIFKVFLEGYIKVFGILCEKSKNCLVDQDRLDEYEIKSSPFAKKVSKAFSTSQALTGFGAAMGIMKDKGIIEDFDSLDKIVRDIEENYTNDEEGEWFMEFLKRMDMIKVKAKKIGNAQRMYLEYFYRELFNEESDSYANLLQAVENGYRKFDSQVNG